MGRVSIPVDFSFGYVVRSLLIEREKSREQKISGNDAQDDAYGCQEHPGPFPKSEKDMQEPQRHQKYEIQENQKPFVSEVFDDPIPWQIETLARVGHQHCGENEDEGCKAGQRYENSIWPGSVFLHILSGLSFKYRSWYEAFIYTYNK